MHYFSLAEQDLLNGLDIGELEQEERSLKIESLFRSVPPNFKNVTDVVDLQIDEVKYVRALILIKWANDYGKFDLDEQNRATNNEHFCMSRLIFKAYEIIRKNISKTDLLGNLLAIAEKYGEPLMVEMYEKVKRMQLPDKKRKVNSEAISCHLITSVRGCLRMYTEAIMSGKESVEMLKKQFGEDAKKIQTFGHALTVIGLAYNKLEKFGLGEQYLKESYQAKKGATDFADEETRESYIRYTKNLMGEHDYDFFF